ncbi:MAG: cbb3-type cytochrome c oxidase subunit 3 [Litorimonas sp.]
MSYDQIAHVIKIGGTVAFTAVFLGAIAYALWPRNRAKFDRAAQLPLQSDDGPDLTDPASNDAAQIDPARNDPALKHPSLNHPRDRS